MSSLNLKPITRQLVQLDRLDVLLSKEQKAQLIERWSKEITPAAGRAVELITLELPNNGGGKKALLQFNAPRLRPRALAPAMVRFIIENQQQALILAGEAEELQEQYDEQAA